MQTYKGSCHCGAVGFEVEADIEEVIECNCSHCERKGLLLTFAPAVNFKLISGEDNLSEYRFNKKQIAHLFCKTCGVQSFSKSTWEGVDMMAINVRALAEIDIETMPRKKVDGKSV